jgi:phenylacetic acid degradation protein/carnitine operon protein CaiE
MNAVVMDDVELGDESIVGALSFIKTGEKIPSRSLIAGNPAKVIRQVSDEMIKWKTEGTALYQALPKEMSQHWKECESLTEIPEERPTQETLYKTWQNIKDGKKGA